MKFLFCFIICSAVAMAGTVTITGTNTPFADLFGPGNDSGVDDQGILAVTPPTTSSNGYTFSGTVCYQGYCPGQGGVVGSGPNYTVNSPLTMTLTSMTLTCTQSGGCSSTANVNADFGFLPVSFGNGTVLSATAEIDGIAPANYSFLLDAGAQAFDSDFNETSSVSLNDQAVTANGSGAFSAMFNLGNLMVNDGFVKAQLILSVSDLGNGQSINFPNSLTITLGTSSSAPEPASILLMLAGMGGLGMLAYKRGSSYSSRNAIIGSSLDARRAGK